MRAPQYGHHKGKRRGTNPFSRPVVRFVSHKVGNPTSKLINASVTAPRAQIAISTPNNPITLHLWHKSAKRGDDGRKLPASQGPVISKPVAVEMRLLCAVAVKDKFKSRNDRYRQYAWPSGALKSGKQ